MANRSTENLLSDSDENSATEPRSSAPFRTIRSRKAPSSSAATTVNVAVVDVHQPSAAPVPVPRRTKPSERNVEMKTISTSAARKQTAGDTTTLMESAFLEEIIELSSESSAAVQQRARSDSSSVYRSESGPNLFFARTRKNTVVDAVDDEDEVGADIPEITSMKAASLSSAGGGGSKKSSTRSSRKSSPAPVVNVSGNGVGRGPKRLMISSVSQSDREELIELERRNDDGVDVEQEEVNSTDDGSESTAMELINESSLFRKLMLNKRKNDRSEMLEMREKKLMRKLKNRKSKSSYAYDRIIGR